VNKTELDRLMNEFIRLREKLSPIMGMVGSEGLCRKNIGKEIRE
jgi:hypothetical protein